MAVTYFGARWDAPRLDDAVQVPTPVGVPCLWCGHPIANGDRGTMSAVMRSMGGVDVVPGHMECELPSIFGGPSHIRGTCTHIGSCQDGYDDRRELGLATLAALNEERAARGQGPL